MMAIGAEASNTVSDNFGIKITYSSMTGSGSAESLMATARYSTNGEI